MTQTSHPGPIDILNEYINNPPVFSLADLTPTCTDYRIEGTSDGKAKLVFIEEKRDPIMDAYYRAVEAGIEAGVFVKTRFGIIATPTSQTDMAALPEHLDLFDSVYVALGNSRQGTFKNIFNKLNDDAMISQTDARAAVSILTDIATMHPTGYTANMSLRFSDILKRKSLPAAPTCML